MVDFWSKFLVDWKVSSKHYPLQQFELVMFIRCWEKAMRKPSPWYQYHDARRLNWKFQKHSPYSNYLVSRPGTCLLDILVGPPVGASRRRHLGARYERFCRTTLQLESPCVRLPWSLYQVALRSRVHHSSPLARFWLEFGHQTQYGVQSTSDF